MEAFRQRYFRICRELQVTPLDCVISQISQEIIPESKTLDLSSYNMTPEDCHALGSSLTDDLFFKELVFADCLLSEESCKLLLLGLAANRSITSLNLKGNNIRCGGAEVLGQFLKKNTSVHSLRLEWNSLGLWDSGIAALAEGLALNQSLVILDIRNNQITHEGGAQLADALKRNKTLKGLDLRWNNLGLLGGREMLSVFKYNKSITCIELTGNNIPQDILKAVFLASKQNFDVQSLDEKHRNTTEMITRELEKAENLKTKEVLLLKDEMEKERTQHEHYYSTTQDTIKQLNNTLIERKLTFDDLSSKLSTTEMELSLADKKCQDLQSLCTNLQNELHAEREQRTNAELLHHKEMNKVLERSMELECNVSSAERKNKALEITIDNLEKEIEKVSNNHKVESQESDRLFKNELQNTKERFEKEFKELHHKMSESTQNSQTKLLKLEEERHSLEKELSTLRSENMKIRLESDEQLMNAKAILKQDEMIRCKQYEERLAMIQSSRDELHAQNSKQLSEMSQVQTNLNTITHDFEVQKRQFEQLKQKMDQKEMDYNQEIANLKMELEATKKDVLTQRSFVANLEAKASEESRRHNETIDSKDREILFLNDKLKSKDSELKRHHDEEIKRAEMLEKAIFSFVSSTRTSTH